MAAPTSSIGAASGEQADRAGARIELEEVLEIRDGAPKRVVTDYGAYLAGAVILATGTFLKGKIFVGDVSYEGGPDGMFAATALTGQSLRLTHGWAMM